MKSLKILAITIVILPLTIGFLTQCSDDEKGNQVDYTNYFEYEKKKYPLNQGWIRNDEDLAGGVDHTTICLYSDGLEWDDTSEEFSGKGNILYIRFRRDGSELEEGIYNYQASTEGPYLLTLSTLSFSVNWDMNTNSGTYGYFREGSEVEFAKDGTNYSISFTLIPTLSLGNIESDTPVTGYYLGTLATLD